MTSTTTFRPTIGRAYLIGYGSGHAHEGEWLYIIHQDDEARTAYGVRFRNVSRAETDPTAAAPAFDTIAFDHLHAGSADGHPLTVVPWWPGVVATFLGDATRGENLATNEATHEAYLRGRAEVQREVEAWKEMATETAHRYANNNNLCGEFDRCMEEIGLRPRTRDYTVSMTVTLSVVVPVTADTSESAVELAIDRFRDEPRYVLENYASDLSHADVEVDDVEAD